MVHNLEKSRRNDMQVQLLTSSVLYVYTLFVSPTNFNKLLVVTELVATGHIAAA